MKFVLISCNIMSEVSDSGNRRFSGKFIPGIFRGWKFCRCIGISTIRSTRRDLKPKKNRAIFHVCMVATGWRNFKFIQVITISIANWSRTDAACNVVNNYFFLNLINWLILKNCCWTSPLGALSSQREVQGCFILAEKINNSFIFGISTYINKLYLKT